ncbi:MULTISPECIES: AraC family transcriptional regulator [Blautia]|uniref:AraC family transcriptional regulator n=1 Tax=Blautia TaxID=572511 RepID=UPI000BA3D5D5|nr:MULTISPECIES: AraC family transcriptional regulator [Blautia]
MEYNRGIFGVLNQDDMEGQPLVLLDGGVESRLGETYDFYNDDRPGYEGFLFQYTLGGEGVFEKNNFGYKVRRGQGFLVQFPEKSRYYLENGRDEPWEFLYLHFLGDGAIPFVRKIRNICPDLMSLDESSPPIRMALHLQKRLTNGERLQKYQGGEFLYRFLCALLRETEHPAAQKKSSAVQRAAEIMEEEYPRLTGIEELAARLDLSPEHLSRAFKDEMGRAPLSYLTGLRLQSAMNDLLGTEWSIDSIARKNGFSNGNYFAKIFRKHVGISPGSYRESNGNGKCSRKGMGE